MSYMSFKEYQAIMEEEGYVESQAVKLFLNRAKHYQRMKLVLEKQEASDIGNPVLLKYISALDYKRWVSVWQAIDCACVEKSQGFKFFESGGGDNFANTMMIVHEGKLEAMNEIEKCTFAYFELLDEMRKRQVKGYFE